LATCQQAASASRPAYRSHYLYNVGRILDADERYEEAADLFTQAAKAGNGFAADNLAELYETGHIKRDPVAAAHWYEAAGSIGYPDGTLQWVL
jgi:TPR repeat protein